MILKRRMILKREQRIRRVLHEYSLLPGRHSRAGAKSWHGTHVKHRRRREGLQQVSGRVASAGAATPG
jgi:hypothetical protein